MKRIIFVIFVVTILAGCSKEFQSKISETSVGVNINDFDDVAKFSNVYEMWKHGVDRVYIYSGVDEYTETYLLETMPQFYSTIIKSLSKYGMEAYAVLDEGVLKDNSEIDNILKYNESFKNERIKGINVDINASEHVEELEEISRKIKDHNQLTNDNIILSIVTDELLNDNLIIAIDEVIYEGYEEEVDSVLKQLSKYNKKTSIAIKNEKNLSFLSNLSNNLDNFNKYDSFDGLMIKYDDYKDLTKTKRP